MKRRHWYSFIKGKTVRRSAAHRPIVNRASGEHAVGIRSVAPKVVLVRPQRKARDPEGAHRGAPPEGAPHEVAGGEPVGAWWELFDVLHPESKQQTTPAAPRDALEELGLPAKAWDRAAPIKSTGHATHRRRDDAVTCIRGVENAF